MQLGPRAGDRTDWQIDRVFQVLRGGGPEAESIRTLLAWILQASHNSRDGNRIERLEAELSAARERLVRQEPLRTMGELAAGVGHDLTNVFTALKLRSALIAKTTPTTSVLLRHVDAIARAAEQGSALASKLLSMARPASGRPASVDLRQTVHAAIELAQTALRNRPGGRIVPLRIVVQLPRLPKVLGRPEDIQRVFVNLLLNARDAMVDGGTVTVRGRVCRGTVFVLIDDDGPGIPGEVLPRIFDMFFTTKGQNGSGVGLAVVKQVMESLGGSISARNRRRGGARFDLRFPVFVDRDGPG